MRTASHNPAELPRDVPRAAPALARNIASNYAALVVNAVLMLALAPYLVRCLGTAGYGAWLLAGTIVGYSGLLDLGVTKGLARYVARFAGAGEHAALEATLGSALLFFTVAGMLSATLVVAGAQWLAVWFDLPAELLPAFRTAIVVLGVNVGIALPTRVFGAALMAREAFVPANVVVIATQVLATGAMVAVLGLGHGLVGIALVQLGATCVSAAANYFVCRRRFPDMHFRMRAFRGPVLRDLIVYGLFAMLWVLADQLRFKLSPVVVGKCVSMSAVAVFGVAVLLLSQCGNLLSAAQVALVPRLSALDGRGEAAAFQALFLRSSRVAGQVAAVVFSLAVLLGQPFVRVWFGPEFAASYWVLVVLAPAYCLTRTQSMSAPALYALGRHRQLACLLVLEGAVNVVLSIGLALRWGVYGAAVGVALPMLLTATVVVPWQVCRAARVPLAEYYRGVLVRPWLLFGCAWAAALVAATFGAGSPQAVCAATLTWGLIGALLVRWRGATVRGRRADEVSAGLAWEAGT